MIFFFFKKTVFFVYYKRFSDGAFSDYTPTSIYGSAFPFYWAYLNLFCLLQKSMIFNMTHQLWKLMEIFRFHVSNFIDGLVLKCDICLLNVENRLWGRKEIRRWETTLLLFSWWMNALVCKTKNLCLTTSSFSYISRSEKYWNQPCI